MLVKEITWNLNQQRLLSNCKFRLQLIIAFLKNVSSSTSHKKTPSLREFKKILPSTYIYEQILIKNCMNGEIMNTQIFPLINMTSEVIEGHIRSLLRLKSIFVKYLFLYKISSYQNFV